MVGELNTCRVALHGVGKVKTVLNKKPLQLVFFVLLPIFSSFAVVEQIEHFVKTSPNSNFSEPWRSVV